MIDTIRFPDLKALVEYGHSLSLQVGFYLNTCICMEKGRTYFEQDVEFMNQMGFDTVCNAPAHLAACLHECARSLADKCTTGVTHSSELRNSVEER